MSQTHFYWQIPNPANSPFELKPSVGKGWGAFATRYIPEGAIIATEKPMLIMRNVPPRNTSGYTALHAAFECEIQAKVQKLATDAKQLFLCLRKDPLSPYTHRDTFGDNSFSLHPGPSSGVYVLLSRFNHSCVPNAHVPHSQKQELTLKATKDITKGEEISFCYTETLESKTRAQRQQVLWQMFRSSCICNACTFEARSQLVSDMRHSLIRGLKFLILGYDDEMQINGTSPHIITDPDLKKAVTNRTGLPLSSFFLYHIFLLFLLEQEGILSHTERKSREPTMRKLASCFENKENSKVALQVLMEKDMDQRLGLAMKISERRDSGDWVVGMFLGSTQAPRPRGD